MADKPYLWLINLILNAGSWSDWEVKDVQIRGFNKLLLVTGFYASWSNDDVDTYFVHYPYKSVAS